MRGAWVEISVVSTAAVAGLSLPVRGAWVEMAKAACTSAAASVAPRAGSVG